MGISGSVLLIIFRSLISLCFITCLIHISLNLKNDQKNRPHDPRIRRRLILTIHTIVLFDKSLRESKDSPNKSFDFCLVFFGNYQNCFYLCNYVNSTTCCSSYLNKGFLWRRCPPPSTEYSSAAKQESPLKNLQTPKK